MIEGYARTDVLVFKILFFSDLEKKLQQKTVNFACVSRNGDSDVGDIVMLVTL